jgi:hypothetical protein
MKRVFAPHLGRDVVIGACKMPDRHAPRLYLGDYVDLSTLPPSPESCDYSAPAMPVITNLEGNDAYGDCVEAEDAHFIAVMTGNTGSLFSYTPAMTLAAYTALTGFNPNIPSTDQGTDPTVDMNYYVQNPYADGTKLLGWASVDATNKALVQFAISTFGNLKLWVSLPDAWTNPFPSSSGFVWDVASPDSNNGHCIGSCAYNSTLVSIVGANSQGVQVMTWGLIGTVTWAAFAALFVPAAGGGAAVRITPDWWNKSTGKAPNGFAASDLASDFNKYFGGSVAIPAPPIPPPSPSPAPSGPPSLAAAQAAVTKALSAQLPLIQRSKAISTAASALAPLWP